MKLLLLILALTIHQITSQGIKVGEYVKLDPEAENDPEIQDILKFGIGSVIDQEVAAEKLPEDEYTVTQIYSIWKQLVNGNNYRFDVDISNDLGWVIRVTFVVYVFSGEQKVTDYVCDVTKNPNASEEEEEFTISEEEGIIGEYTEIDPSELDSDEALRDALDAGVADVVQNAFDHHSLPWSTYRITQVNSIYEQLVNRMNYRFNVDLKNCVGLAARTVFVVYAPFVPPGDPQTYEITMESLNVTTIPDEGLIGGVCSVEDGEDGSSRL